MNAVDSSRAAKRLVGPQHCVCTETLAVLNAAKWAGTPTTFTAGGDNVRGGGPKYQTWIEGAAFLNGGDAVARANELRQLLGGAGHVVDLVLLQSTRTFEITSKKSNPDWYLSIKASAGQNHLVVQTWSRKEADAEFAATLRQNLRPILD